MLRLLLFLTNLVVTTYGLLGFDCGSQHLNVTSVSLLGTGDCDDEYHTTNSTSVYVQLLQLSEYSYTEVMQCKMEISRTIQYCGMHSHVSAVNNARMEYLLDVGYEKCQRALQDGIFSMGNAGEIAGLKPNTTSVHSLMLAGSVSNNGRCQGTQYSDPYGTWDNVIVDALLRISLKTSYVPVHLSSGRILLKSGTVCDLSNGFCIDSEDGHTYWKPMPTSSCNFHQYDVLYEGQAVKTTNSDRTSPSPTVYSLSTEDITFALTASKEQPLCGYTLLTTEHPKLFILETKRGDTFAHHGTIPVGNLDIFTYVNSKFVYVEKHMRQQMTSLYNDVVKQRCELEKEVIRNTLSFATLQPDEFAYRLMKGPGYMAVAAGEAIHIVKCIPVDTLVRKTPECYHELPVTVRNASFFLTPKSRLLTKFGTVRECTYELPTLYLIEDTWIQFTPDPHVREVKPQQLKPLTSLSWKYLTPGSLATSGIYAQKDTDRLRNRIMFPAEKPALLNLMARGMTGQPVKDGSVSIYNLLDEASLQKIAETTASRIWGGFVKFGSATAGIFGIFIIVRLIKLTIDTLIHGYALHSAYGCSLYIFGAVWSSLTHLLLFFAKGPAKHDESEGSNITLYPESLPARPDTTLFCGNASNVIVPQQAKPRTIYTDLTERLHEMERLPPKTSESVP